MPVPAREGPRRKGDRAGVRVCSRTRITEGEVPRARQPADVRAHYAALAALCRRDGDGSAVGDVTTTELRRLFNTRPGLVATNLGWKTAHGVRTGRPIFGRRRAFVSDSDALRALWRTLGIRHPPRSTASTFSTRSRRRRVRLLPMIGRSSSTQSAISATRLARFGAHFGDGPSKHLCGRRRVGVVAPASSQSKIARWRNRSANHYPSGCPAAPSQHWAAFRTPEV